LPNPFSTNRPQTLYAALALLGVAVLFGGATRYEVGTTILPRLAALAAIVYLFWPRNRSPLPDQRRTATSSESSSASMGCWGCVTRHSVNR